MPYIAYRDRTKKQKIKAKDTTIADTHYKFYCGTPNCTAYMSLVNAANEERAYFRRIPSGPEHSSPFCSADGAFDSTKYEENKFDFDRITTNLINSLDDSNVTRGKGSDTLTGGGGKKTISTIYQIYCMCRKYSVYNGYSTDNILSDERNFNRYTHGITGNKIVQCTPYHKFKDEFSYRMNYPSFPYRNGKHLKLKFATKELFWYFFNKFKTTNHKELVIVLGNWSLSSANDNYTSECTIYKRKQIHFLT